MNHYSHGTVRRGTRLTNLSITQVQSRITEAGSKRNIRTRERADASTELPAEPLSRVPSHRVSIRPPGHAFDDFNVLLQWS
jgi:hypothetical protein